MTHRIVFVTHELEGVTPGGAGTVVAGLSSALSSAGWDVTVVLATPAGAVTVQAPGVTVIPITVATDGTLVSFLERSRHIAEVLGELVASGPLPDLIEFHDFDIPAWWALTHREELGLGGVRLAIRLHGPVDAMIAAMGKAPPVLSGVAELERLLFTMADLVIVPSAAMRTWAHDRYAVEDDRLVVSPPPVPLVSALRRRRASDPEFVAYGRLNEVKGSHDLVDAALPVLEQYPRARVRFIGGDGWSASENRPMSEMLQDRIPRERRDNFTFEDAVGRDAALTAMTSAWAAVVPSRFESFCISLHEVRRAGLPVIAAALPAFDGFAHGAGVLTYDGSIRGLTAALLDAAAHPDHLDRLADEPVPVVGDPIAAYSGPMPSVRHPRSQAGLATAAVKRAELLTTAPSSSIAGLASRLLRALPEPMARVARRIAPRSLKERFRRVASWPEEVARRERAQLFSDLRKRVRRGEFPPREAPQVSVVIPCFEQGQWLEDAIASVFAQTFDSWEIVLVDDGSTDLKTIGLLDEFGAWSRVRLVRQKNRGLSAARNAGISRAKGDFVVPLDADDELTPEFLEVMTAALADQPVAAFAHCWARLFGDVDAVWVPRPFNPYWQRLGNGIVGCVLLRKSAWTVVGGYDETMRRGHEDWDIWLRLDAAGWGQVRVDRPLFRYRKRGISMSVLSEAGFEEGLAELQARHPEWYTRTALESLKREWYPLLSLIADSETRYKEPPLSPEIVVSGDPRSTTGKYLADVRGRFVVPDDLLGLAANLETTPDKAGAMGGDGVVVWRRWALLDPDAPVAGILGGAAPADGELGPGILADAEWTVDPALIPDGVGVQRQRPEESGSLPGWVVA